MKKITFASFILFGIISNSLLAVTPLKSGAPLDGEFDSSLPRTTVLVVFTGGSGTIPKEIQGVTAILERMLEEGPKDMSGDEYRETLFLLGAEISYRVGARSFQVVAAAPPDHLKEALALARRTLMNPKFDDTEFKRAKQRVESETLRRNDSMSSLLRYFAFRDAFQYGPDILDGAGSLKTLANIDLEVSKSTYKKLLNFDKAFFSSIGNTAESTLVPLLNEVFFSGGEIGSFEIAKFTRIAPAALKTKERKIAIVHKAGVVDNQVLFIFPEAVEREGAERLNGEVAHQILGGGLTGRLSKTLRTERGLTYYAGSFLGSTIPAWGVSTFGGNDQVLGLIQGVPEVVQNFKKETFKAGEIADIRLRMTGSFRLSQELPQDRVIDRLGKKLYGVSENFNKEYLTLLSHVTPKSLKEFVDKKVDATGGYLYLMGDKDKLLPILAKAGASPEKVRIVDVGDIL